MDEEERTSLLDPEKTPGFPEDGGGRPRRNWMQRLIRILQSDTLIPDPEECTFLEEGLLLSLAKTFTYAVVPSFFRDSTANDENTRGTEWLDGLRGLAAWCVMNSHLASLLVKWSAAGYGSDDGSGNQHTNFWMLPFVRLSFAGQFSVYIFFVISGYALSLSPVRRMNKADNATETLRALSSSALRRPIRLFVPALASTLLGFLTIRLGLIEWSFGIFQRSTVLDGWESRWTQFPIASDVSLWAQFVDLSKESLKLLDIVKSTQSVPAYNPVLWTIVIEYRASLMLYLMHLAFFRLQRRYRGLLAALVLGLSILLGYLYELLFIFGYAMAELTSHQTRTHPADRKAKWKKASWIAAAIFALWLASMPGFLPQYAPMYTTLGAVNPLGIDEAGHAWHRVAAMILFVALSQETFLQWPFQTRFGIYLGKISFSLYLVHLPVVTVLGTFLFDKCMSVDTSTGVSAAAWPCAAYIAMALPVFYLADRFQELVDQPSVHLGRYLERRTGRRIE